MPDASVWEEIRRAYADQTIRTMDICKIYAVPYSDLRKRAADEGWPRRLNAVELAKARKAALADDGVASTVSPTALGPAASVPSTPALPSTAKRKPTPIAYRRALVQRLYAVIDAKLSLLERRFARDMAVLDGAKGKAVSSADNERDIRAIGSLIKTLEQMTEYDHGHELGTTVKGAAAKSAAIASNQLADEADRIRRELGERLQRFVDVTKTGAD